MHAPSREWNAYGGAPDQSRYSSLDQINRTNVQSLRVARTFDTGETGGLQTQPIVVRLNATYLDPDGYPAVRPPWGTLSAVDLNTAEYAWQSPLGEYPALVEPGCGTRGPKTTAAHRTAGGLLFIGATSYDRKFRAFDKVTGALLWESTLPFAAALDA
jgi:glucose dehydrogenase